MRKKRFWRAAVFAGTLAGSAALVAAASGATGAFFNDSQSGTVTGNIGSILVSTSGGSGSNGLDFNLSNMLPGVPQTVTAHFTNTGKNAQDVYLVFPNAEALHSLNNLGTYGSVTIKSAGTTVFSSSNLNDGLDANLANDGHCPTFGPGSCYPVPNTIKLASNVAPGQSGSMSFSFAFASKLKSASAEGAQAFCYPLVQVSGSTNPADQTCTTTSPTYGLPYQIVATQPGVLPNNPNNTDPTP